MYLSDAVRDRIRYYQNQTGMSLWGLFKASGVPMSTLAAFMSKRTELIKLDTFESVQNNINQNKMTVVYFTGNSCGACEVIKEKIEKFLENYPNIKAYEVNGEENTKIAYKYSVFSMPVFLLFIEGKESIRTGKHVDLLSLERSIDRYYNMIY